MTGTKTEFGQNPATLTSDLANLKLVLVKNQV